MPLDINCFREEKGGDLETLSKSQAARYKPQSEIDDIITLDKEWRELTFQANQLNKQINTLSKEYGQRMKAKADVSDLQTQIASAKQEKETVEQRVKELESVIQSKLRSIGNLVHSSVPVSNDESNNHIEREWGEKRSSTSVQYHHHELLTMIDGYSPDRGVTVAGHRGYFLKGVAVLLNQALINYGLQFLMQRQYTPLQPPYFMKRDVMSETAQLEQFDEELYKVTGDADDLYLIATSEQPISAYHRQEWLSKDQLPLRYAGLSTCFRKEAGSHGKDTWGIFRIHQFEKVEQFCITSPDESWPMHEEMIRACEEFYQSLKLPYRIVNIVSGALNNAAGKKYDLEAWFPTLGVYRELVSASNCTDYQARAMETRFGHKKMDDKGKQYVHMLNATLCATERTICCILENYQTETGVAVPEVLRPYMGGLEEMKFVQPPPKPTQTAQQHKQNKQTKTDSN